MTALGPAPRLPAKPGRAASLAAVAALAALAATLLAAPVAADPPADAFCVIVIEGAEGMALVRVKVDEETSLEDRAALWPAVDLDGDGRIPREEQQAFRENQTRVWPGGDGLGNKTVTMATGPLSAQHASPRRPLHAVTWRQVGHEFHKQPYQLPEELATVAELETQEVREFRFDTNPEHAVVQLRGGGNVSGLPAQASPEGVPRVSIEYVVVRAPPGWVVDRIEGHTYDGPFVLEPLNATVDVPAFDTKSPWTVQFVHLDTMDTNRRLASPSGGIPAPGALAAAAIALAIAWARRKAIA